MSHPEGVLVVDKPSGRTSFSLVAIARSKTGQRCVGHAGTLDPLATGVLVLLLGKKWTKCSNQFINQVKEYQAIIRLGQATDTYDREGKVTEQSSIIPSEEQLREQLSFFQGTYMQVPPMYSAKKINGSPLYSLARKGITIERTPEPVQLVTRLIEYRYPDVHVHIRCSKGTYIRTIAHDLGIRLGCFGHIQELRRTVSGSFDIQQAISFEALEALTPLTVGKAFVDERQILCNISTE